MNMERLLSSMTPKFSNKDHFMPGTKGTAEPSQAPVDPQDLDKQNLPRIVNTPILAVEDIDIEYVGTSPISFT